MKKVICDIGDDGTLGGCAKGSLNCPKFVLDEHTRTVTLIDRHGNKSNMSVEEWNRFHRLIRRGIIKKI